MAILARIVSVVAGAALVTAAAGTASAQTPPVISLQLDRSVYRVGDGLGLHATLAPGTSRQPIDVYIQVQLPDGSLLSLLASGLVPGTVPIARGLGPVSFAGQIFQATITSAVPSGTYYWRAFLTLSGTLEVVGRISEVPFVVGASPTAVFYGLNFSPWLSGESP